MAINSFMDMVRSFFGFRHEPPRNDFRNPIWGSDDEDDGDELYSRSHMDVYQDPMELHREITRQVQDMFRSFGGVFGDLSSFFEDPRGAIMDGGVIIDGGPMMRVPTEPDHYDNSNIRDYYLKPGYKNERQDLHKDMDLDGKISSEALSELLKKKEDGQLVPVPPFNGNIVPGRSYCQTIITTSVTKPDGTVETRRIVKKGNEVVEETVTRVEPSNSLNNGPSPISTPNNIFSSIPFMPKIFF